MATRLREVEAQKEAAQGMLDAFAEFRHVLQNVRGRSLFAFDEADADGAEQIQARENVSRMLDAFVQVREAPFVARRVSHEGLQMLKLLEDKKV